MRRLVGVLAITACFANLASGAQSEFDDENSRTPGTSSPTPIMFSIRGGVIGAFNFDWYQPTGEEASSRFTAFGLCLEAHDLKGFVAGMGADYSWNTWTRDHDVQYYGRQIQRINSYFVYGTFGRELWKQRSGRERSWCSVDIGKMWCNEEPGWFSTTTYGSGNFSGVAVRLRASYLRKVNSSLAIGLTGGWQWAEPKLQQHHSPSIDPVPRLRLSGPMIAAQISLFGQLGRN